MNHIVVIGFMGSGKTRVGKRLSSDLGLTFVDVDKVIVKQDEHVRKGDFTEIWRAILPCSGNHDCESSD